MIAPFFIAGFDTPSDLCCRIRLYNKGLCPLTPEFIALGFRRSKKEQHQVLLLQTSNNNYGWNKYHAGIFGEVNSTPYPCKSKFKSEVWDNWNLIFQLTLSWLVGENSSHMLTACPRSHTARHKKSTDCCIIYTTTGALLITILACLPPQ